MGAETGDDGGPLSREEAEKIADQMFNEAIKREKAHITIGESWIAIGLGILTGLGIGSRQTDLMVVGALFGLVGGILGGAAVDLSGRIKKTERARKKIRL